MTRLRVPLLAALALVVLAVALFQLFQRQITGAWLTFALHPEAMGMLEQSRDDQRDLARAHPEEEAEYRRRFEEIQQLVQRLKILEHNRDRLARRYEQVLLGLFVGTIVLAVGLVHWQRRRDEARLERLRLALTDLATGRTDLRLGERGRDTIGRIARMVEETSRRMARDRRRLRSLENLSAWQEAARRHAHEMKTPLTGARLELERLGSLMHARDAETPSGGGELRQAVASVQQELERLDRFTKEFTSFARLPRPSLEPLDLRAMVAEFVTTFDGAWGNLGLELEAGEADGEDPPTVNADRDMLRQVLVNLCDNSSLALDGAEGEGARGKVRFRLGIEGDQVMLEVADDGPGVEPALRERIFEPYVTTRGIGKGMGLGLAICRKILLDHGGDLELLATDPARRGATFRLGLPLPTQNPGPSPPDGGSP